VDQVKDYPFPAIAGQEADLHQYWPSLKASEKRRIIEGLVERIVLGQDDIDITLCAPSSAASTGVDAVPSPSSNEQANDSPLGEAMPSSTSEQRVDPIALAIALMKDHPEWSARKLAQAAGCAHTTLTRSALFRTAKSLADAKQSRPQGWRRSDGRIEARGDADDDDAGST
jgi:hypothetical protein